MRLLRYIRKAALCSDICGLTAIYHQHRTRRIDQAGHQASASASGIHRTRPRSTSSSPCQAFSYTSSDPSCSYEPCLWCLYHLPKSHVLACQSEV